MPRNRFTNALYIQQGACNVSGIARSLVEAADVAREDGQASEDAAVRLIVHQLAYLCKVGEINDDPLAYSRLLAECEEKAEMPEP